MSRTDKEQDAVYALKRALLERVVEWDKSAKEFDADTRAFIIEAAIAEFFADFLRNAIGDVSERAKFLTLVDRLASSVEHAPPPLTLRLNVSDTSWSRGVTLGSAPVWLLPKQRSRREV